MTMRTLRPLSVGEVLDTTLGVYREAFVPLLMVTVVTQAIPLLWGAFTRPEDVLTRGVTPFIVQILLAVALGSVGTAASTFIVSEAYLGRRLTMGEAMARAVPFIGRILVTGLLAGLVTGIGFLLLVVPGIIAACGLLLSTPALVLEGLPRASDALSRSWKLTGGLRGRIFVVLLVGAFLLYVPLLALTALVAAVTGTGGQPSVLSIVVAALVQLAVYPLFYVAMVVLYYDAKVRKEGFDLEILAQRLLPA